MIDWRNATYAVDYRPDLLLREAEEDRIAREAELANEERPAGRPSVIGVLLAAMVALIATGAIAPR